MKNSGFRREISLGSHQRCVTDFKVILTTLTFKCPLVMPERASISLQYHSSCLLKGLRHIVLKIGHGVNQMSELDIYTHADHYIFFSLEAGMSCLCTQGAKLLCYQVVARV